MVRTFLDELFSSNLQKCFSFLCLEKWQNVYAISSSCSAHRFYPQSSKDPYHKNGKSKYLLISSSKKVLTTWKVITGVKTSSHYPPFLRCRPIAFKMDSLDCEKCTSEQIYGPFCRLPPAASCCELWLLLCVCVTAVALEADILKTTSGSASFAKLYELQVILKRESTNLFFWTSSGYLREQEESKQAKGKKPDTILLMHLWVALKCNPCNGTDCFGSLENVLKIHSTWTHWIWPYP